MRSGPWLFVTCCRPCQRWLPIRRPIARQGCLPAASPSSSALCRPTKWDTTLKTLSTGHASNDRSEIAGGRADMQHGEGLQISPRLASQTALTATASTARNALMSRRNSLVRGRGQFTTAPACHSHRRCLQWRGPCKSTAGSAGAF